MTPSQTVADLVSTIPSVGACCGQSTQEVPIATLNALRTAAANACDEEECVHRLLAQCRVLARLRVVQAQVQADADASGLGRPREKSENALSSALELLNAIEARLGVEND